MSTVPLLDTHAWIWWVQGDPRLGAPILKKLDDLPAKTRPVISDISLWEAAMLVSLGRLQLPSTLDSWLAIAAHPKTVRVLPISPRVATEVARLPSTFQRDPADRLIVSCSRVHGLPVLTRDAAIAKSGLVRLWSPGAVGPSYEDLLPRLYELKATAPDPSHINSYFLRFEEELSKSEGVLQYYIHLDRLLQSLDPAAWSDLKMRASVHVISRERDLGWGWREMFDVLEEAKAYDYLQRVGCSHVRFIERGKDKTPDLIGTLDGARVLCEVKTIDPSKGEADRRARTNRGEIVSHSYGPRLDPGFMTKLRSKIKSAVAQLDAYDPDRQARRIVFVVLNFDDDVGRFQPEYVQQIDQDLLDSPIAGIELVFCLATNHFERSFTMRSAAVYRAQE